MQKLELQVRGKERKVYLEKSISPTTWLARVYVGSKVVSGKLVKYSNGIKRFYPLGKHAGLI